MPSFTTRIEDGWIGARTHLPLALVPLLTALFDTEKIDKVLTFGGYHFGFRFGLPTNVVDLWQFVSVPNQGVNIEPGIPVSFPSVLVVLPVFVVVRAALTAGYFGSIDDVLATDSYDFIANTRRYFVPFFWFALVPMLLLVPLILVEVSGRGMLVPLIIVSIPANVVLSYLFYATPYLIVLRDTDFVSAVRASYVLAVAGGPYLQYALGFAGFVLIGSLFATVLVVNLGLLGILLGVVGVAPIGLATNIATMRFIADIDAESPTFGTWGGNQGDPVAEGFDANL